MKKEFLASILITNYNKEKFVNSALLSAVRQNYKKKEIIIFDDKSTDNSIKIIEKFKKIKIIKNNKKKNKSGSLNQINGLIKCFKESSGKYVFLMDSDDEFKKNKIKSIMSDFNKNSNLNLIQDKPYLNKENIVLTLKKKSHFFSIWPSIYPTSCIAIKRSFFKEFLKYIAKDKFPNLEIDSRLIIFAHLKKNLKLLNKSFTIYNYDKDGISSKYKKFSIKWWKKRKEAFEYMYYLMIKLGLNIKKGPDYYLTNLINFLIDLFYNQKKLS